MKIKVNQIPSDGLIVEEDILASELDLETEVTRFSGPIKARARVYRITNAVSVDLNLIGQAYMTCARCLGEFKVDLSKDLKLNYSVDPRQQFVDLDQDIREELILDYPVKPLCSPTCKGLCPKCGNNINEGGCNCAITKKETL